MSDTGSCAVRRTAWQVDWRRLRRRALVLSLCTLAAVHLLWFLAAGRYGADFHFGLWTAARDILDGRSPYPPADPRLLQIRINSFVWPPPLGLVVTPLAELPFSLAALIWTITSLSCFAGALYLVGVRDRRVYLVALCSYPFVDGLAFGQPEGLLALGLAIAWRYRGAWPGALVVGAMIAAKLFAWPLLIWLLVTRRVRAAALGAVSAVGLLLGSWAAISFHGMSGYPKLLEADLRAFEGHSYSFTAEFFHLGASTPLASAAVILAGVVATASVIHARGSDQGWFAAMVGLGVLSSPLVWIHYLVLLLIPLAVRRPTLSWPWLAVNLLWLVPLKPLPDYCQVAFALLIGVAVLLASATKPDGDLDVRVGRTSRSSRTRGPASAITLSTLGREHKRPGRSPNEVIEHAATGP